MAARQSALALVAVAAALLLCVAAPASAATIVAQSTHCTRVICSHKDVTLVSIDSASGNLATLGTVIPNVPRTAIDLELEFFGAYDPRNSSYYLLVVSSVPAALNVSVYAVSVGASSIIVRDHFVLPFLNISAVAWEPVSGHILAVAANKLLAVDPLSHAVSPIATIWSSSLGLVNQGTITLDPSTSSLYVAALPDNSQGTNDDCYYIFGVALGSGSVSQSACLPPDTPLYPLAVSMLYSTKYSQMAVLGNGLLGLQAGYVDLHTGNFTKTLAISQLLDYTFQGPDLCVWDPVSVLLYCLFDYNPSSASAVRSREDPPASGEYICTLNLATPGHGTLAHVSSNQVKYGELNGFALV
jgi:hypothetical protein